MFRDLTGDPARTPSCACSRAAPTARSRCTSSRPTRARGSGLRVVFRSQELRRAQTRVRDGVLRYRSARPQPGDELLLPGRGRRDRLRWRERLHRFTVAERREIAPAEPWGDSSSAPRARAG